jgi:hypothetical protein
MPENQNEERDDYDEEMRALRQAIREAVLSNGKRRKRSKKGTRSNPGEAGSGTATETTGR